MVLCMEKQVRELTVKHGLLAILKKVIIKIYFAIYLDDMQNREVVSGNKAKEIAISILSNEV